MNCQPRRHVYTQSQVSERGGPGVQDTPIKKESFLKDIEELRQVFSLHLIQVTESKVLLNCKFPMAITKGSGTQACIKYD